MLSVGYSQWGRARLAEIPRVLAQKRHASYSKNPMKKDGSFDSLIYNDALFRNKQHVLNPKMINAPETWKLTAGDLKSTGKKIEDEAFPVPVHRYGFWATPFTGNNGLYVGQQIPYDEILPRCKGKLSPLEWKGLSEEDRYTARNFYIRTHSTAPVHTQHMHREDSGQTQFDDIKTQIFYGLIIGFLVYAGSPLSNNRTNAGLNPDDMYEIGTTTNPILTTPGLNLVTAWTWDFGSPGLQAIAQYKYPLWTEAETSNDNVRQTFGNYGSLATAVPQFNWEYRDNGTVKATPTVGFREANELYYDGAEGPDKIGPYHVKLWKTGEKMKTVNDGYETNTVGWYHSGTMPNNP